MTVRLENETVGKVENADIGQIATVTLRAENGGFITDTGKVVEVLEE